MDNSPIFKKFYREWVDRMDRMWAEEERRGIERMRKAQTERHVFLIICLIILGVVAATAYYMDTAPPPGSYCEYPDPYGR